MECLPRTFQDAIIITRRLGYRLLWIDSLCILQDDEDDWKHEAASMGRVYGNSICTIAALGAVNSYEGCFAQRDPLRYHPCRLFATDESGPYAFPSSGLDALHKSFKLAPLNKQGWTFQERLLSPRTLNYGAIVTWECGEHFASESCPQGHLDFGLTAKRRFHHSLSLMNSSQSFELSRFFTDWAEIVYEYSQAEFTFDRDRYYALSGITSAIATSTGLRYICGLWSNFLRQGLLWFIIPSYNDCRGKIWRLTRYEMPSWSWSSVLAPARYPNVVTRMEASDSSYQWLAEVIETGPQPASSPQQSPIPVQYQYIKMSAGLKDVVIKPLGIKGSQIDSMENERCNNSDYRLHQLWLDTQEQYRGSGILLPLLLKHNNNVSDHHKIHGLLLLPTSDHPYEYKRIGYFELVDVPDFSSYVKQDRVTIILV